MWTKNARYCGITCGSERTAVDKNAHWIRAMAAEDPKSKADAIDTMMRYRDTMNLEQKPHRKTQLKWRSLIMGRVLVHKVDCFATFVTTRSEISSWYVLARPLTDYMARNIGSKTVHQAWDQRHFIVLIGIKGLVELDLSIFPMLGDEARGPTALDADKTEWKRLYWILQWSRGLAEQG